MMNREPDEYKLALRARAGDTAALTELVERARLRLFALAYAELRHYQDAEDAVAAALLQVCLHVKELRDPERVWSWMYRIVHNEVHRLRRSPHAPDRSMEDAAAPTDDARLSYLRLDIERTLRRLPVDQARAVALFYLADLSIGEIALQIGRPEGTIKYWLHLGRQRFAAEMEEYRPMAQPPKAARVHPTLLLVDDDREIVRLLKMHLELAGYRVVTALEGREGLRKVAVKKPDLVLLDDLMPGMDGLEVLRDLKASPETASIPVIMLAERTDDAAVFHGYQAGVDVDLTKPINPRELLTYVQQIFDSHAGVEEAELEIPINDGPYAANESPLIRLAHTLLGQALGDGASELHVEPQADRVDILFRTDGELREVMRLPKRLQRKLIARYKLMADMDIEAQSVPQDGRIGVTHKGEEYETRVHSQPAPNGERLLIAISATP